MNWSNDITRVYEQYFRDSFDKLGLVKYEETYGPGVGALIKFKNDSFKIQILNDRGILEIGISSVFGDEQFRGLEMFNSLLQLETNKNVNESEKRKILGTRLDYVGQRNFLLDNSEQLKVILNKKNYKNTLKRIDTLG